MYKDRDVLSDGVELLAAPHQDDISYQALVTSGRNDKFPFVSNAPIIPPGTELE